jgi:hypothetical protein
MGQVNCSAAEALLFADVSEEVLFTEVFNSTLNATVNVSYSTADMVVDEVTVDKLFLWGFIAKVLSTTATALGSVMQKCSHNFNAKSKKKAKECFGILFNWWWMAAFANQVLIPLPLDLFAYAVVPQSLIAPLAGLAIIQNQLFGPWLLKEKLTRIEIYATIVIIIGVTISSVSGPHKDPIVTICMLLHFYTLPAFVVYTVCLYIVMLGMYLAIKSKPKWAESYRPLFFSFISAGTHIYAYNACKPARMLSIQASEAPKIFSLKPSANSCSTKFLLVGGSSGID